MFTQRIKPRKPLPSVKCFGCRAKQLDLGTDRTCPDCGMSPLPSRCYGIDNAFNPDYFRHQPKDWLIYWTCRGVTPKGEIAVWPISAKDSGEACTLFYDQHPRGCIKKVECIQEIEEALAKAKAKAKAKKKS